MFWFKVYFYTEDFIVYRNFCILYQFSFFRIGMKIILPHMIVKILNVPCISSTFDLLFMFIVHFFIVIHPFILLLIVYISLMDFN